MRQAKKGVSARGGTGLKGLIALVENVPKLGQPAVRQNIMERFGGHYHGEIGH